MRMPVRDGWMRGWIAAVLAPMLGLSLAACQPEPFEFGEVWVRLSAVPGRPAAAYFHATGGGSGATLEAIQSPRFGRAELHESMADGMRPIGRLVIPPGAEVRFAPGGRHVMLYNVDPRVRAGTTIPIFFAFTNSGGQVEMQAKVVGAADPAPY